MSVTIAPATEACQALVDHINAGTTYSLDRLATYSRVEVSPLDEVDGLQIDVVSVDEVQLNETLAIEDRTSHRIAIWIRSKLRDLLPETLDGMSLLVRQIFQRVNDFDSDDLRVRVWAVDEETNTTPNKEALHQMGVYAAVIVLRVIVSDSA